jgi:hypothetical protein
LNPFLVLKYGLLSVMTTAVLDAKSTALDVAKALDAKLDGKVVHITGATSGK